MKPHGTLAAVQRHYRANEPLCEKCRAIVRKTSRQRRVKDREKRAEELQQAVSAARQIGGELDARAELRAMYELLGIRLQEAPPQSVAGITKQRVELLDRLTGSKTEDQPAKEEKDGDLIDELAQRRKDRRARTKA